MLDYLFCTLNFFGKPEMHPLRQLPKFFNSSCHIRNREKSCLNLPGKPSQWQAWFLLPLGCFRFWGTEIFETAVTLVKWSLWGNCAHYRSHKCHWTLLKVNTHQKTKKKCFIFKINFLLVLIETSFLKKTKRS